LRKLTPVEPLKNGGTIAAMADILHSVETAVATEAVKQAISSLKSYLSRWKVDVSSSQERFEAAIAQHQREVKNWSGQISFKDILQPKTTSEVFVPLDIYLLPRRQHVSL
jgi:hypothetical protein